jgi:hypothetical protein
MVDAEVHPVKMVVHVLCLLNAASCSMYPRVLSKSGFVATGPSGSACGLSGMSVPLAGITKAATFQDLGSNL